MKGKEYDALVAAIARHAGEEYSVQRIMEDFPQLDPGEVSSVYALEAQKRVKRCYHYYMQPTNMRRIHARYQSAVQGNEEPGILLRMARRYHFSPAMLAKLVLERFLMQWEEEGTYLTSTADSAVVEGVETLKVSSSSLAAYPARGAVGGESCNSSEAFTVEERVPDGRPSGSDADLATEVSAAAGGGSAARMSPVIEDYESIHTNENLFSENSHLIDNDASGARSSITDTSGRSGRGAVEDGIEIVGAASAKRRLNRLCRDPALIPDKVLSMEVHMCLINDEVYGPFADTIKHGIGHEYEVLLCRRLEKRGVGYQTEDDLRGMGCDKTPDVRLDVPIGVDGHVVNWIESKASFGDRDSHRTYLKDQFWSYWNRFGPGLVIYWFGFIEELDNLGEKGIIVRDAFPADIVLLDPLSVRDTSVGPGAAP